MKQGENVSVLPIIFMIIIIIIIGSFVCNTKRPSVKQSIKWQVSSNFQIYPGKS